jgi:preprotein translocase subunit SecG
MTSAITGGSNESFYGQNEGRTREAALARLTKILGILAFITIICANFVIPYIMTFFQTTE